MSGWDGWATNIVASGKSKNVAGCAIYNPEDGNVWGKNGEMDCQAQLDQFDKKADNPGSESVCPPKVNGKKFTFLRKTQDDVPCCVYKSGDDSFFTLAGPSKSRVAVYVKGAKPEPAINDVVTYLKPNI